MRVLGNILWHFPFFGFVPATSAYILGFLLTLTVIAAPIGLGLMEFGKFLFLPFSYSMVNKSDLAETQNSLWAVYCKVVMVLYFPFGLLFAVCAIIQVAVMFVSIVGIPGALVYAKSLGTYFNPVNKRCVPRAVAEELARRVDAAAIERILGGPSIVPKQYQQAPRTPVRRRVAQPALAVVLLLLGLGFACFDGVRGAAKAKERGVSPAAGVVGAFLGGVDEEDSKRISKSSAREQVSDQEVASETTHLRGSNNGTSAQQSEPSVVEKAAAAVNSKQPQKLGEELIFAPLSQSQIAALDEVLAKPPTNSGAEDLEIAEVRFTAAGDSTLLVIRNRQETGPEGRFWNVVSRNSKTGALDVRLSETLAKTLTILPAEDGKIPDLRVNERLISWDGEKYTCVSKDIASKAGKDDLRLCMSIEDSEFMYDLSETSLEGDLNGDGRGDIVTPYVGYLKTGGNMTAQGLAVLLGKEPGYATIAPLSTAALSDLELQDGIIKATTLTYAEDDPSCCPSVKGSARFALKDGHLVEIENAVAQNERETQQFSLCGSDERVLFTCGLKSKIASVCAPSQAPVDSQYIQYRYGTQGSPEIALPAEKVAPIQAAKAGTITYPNGRTSGYLRFQKGEYSYVAYWAELQSGVDADGIATFARHDGVAVEKNGKLVANLKCDSPAEYPEPDYLYEELKFPRNEGMDGFDIPLG